ncbi:hypothetical protein V5O48_018189 [Marasmius crinis-equi]|uniref:BTB domain-containing protein n=1 Tax=Marasmius crinis-equi TaxID=585013 RepID=A0ABR3ELU9_9AGAR
MSSPEPPTQVEGQLKYHPKFDSLEADTVLRSNENTLYRVPSFVLRSTSAFFQSLLSLPTSEANTHQHENDDAHPIPIPHPDHQITPVLSMLCGLEIPSWTSFDQVEEILHLIEEWDAPGPLSIIRSSITAPIFLAEPLRLYAIASHFGWEDEIKLSSTCTLDLNLYGEENQEILHRLPPRSLLALMKLHRSRRDTLKAYLDDPEVFHAGNLMSRICDKCFQEVDNSPWRELKSRIFWEMDKNAKGDAVGGWQMEDWLETTACWNARCKKPGCGHLLYGKTDTLNHLRSCMKRLPQTVEL